MVEPLLEMFSLGEKPRRKDCPPSWGIIATNEEGLPEVATASVVCDVSVRHLVSHRRHGLDIYDPVFSVSSFSPVSSTAVVQ
jgi:hypothetical protein